jgi:Polyketide cyclase / dehydrase and lipid transport
MRVEESIGINRSPKEVFDYVSDVANFPQWTAHTLEVLRRSGRCPRPRPRARAG